MSQPLWQSIALSDNNHDAVWRLFHENSKNRRYQPALSEQEVLHQMGQFHESLPFEGYPVMTLPPLTTRLDYSLGEAILKRRSTITMMPKSLRLEDMVTLLHYAYGVTSDNLGTSLPRPFRAVPSAGALYPLELFFYSTHAQNFLPGLYHYNPSKNHVCLVDDNVKPETIADGFLQSDLIQNTSLLIFITAIFERAVFKYGERGYRYSLIEAGHVAQNIYLVSQALGFASLGLGGFVDDRIDDLLGLDGLRQSTVYAIGIGAGGPDR